MAPVICAFQETVHDPTTMNPAATTEVEPATPGRLLAYPSPGSYRVDSTRTPPRPDRDERDRAITALRYRSKI